MEEKHVERIEEATWETSLWTCKFIDRLCDRLDEIKKVLEEQNKLLKEMQDPLRRLPKAWTPPS